MSRPGVIITGGARRVGASIAYHFAENGYDIALHYNRSTAEAKKRKADIEKLGARCVLFSHNLTNTKGIPALMQKIKTSMPDVTTLVNNASVFERGILMKTDEVLFNRQMDINFKAPFFLMQNFARLFKKGTVVNILDSDIVTHAGSHFAYLLSKKVLAECTIMAARELGPKIRVNAVCPGYVLPSSAADAAYIRKIEKSLPLQKHATLEDITEAVFWLSRQKHITGQIMHVDGGKHVL